MNTVAPPLRRWGHERQAPPRHGSSSAQGTVLLFRPADGTREARRQHGGMTPRFPRRPATIATTLLTALLLGVATAGTAQGVTASSAPASLGRLAPTDARQDATAMRASAVGLRSDVSRLLQQYIDDYGDRFTPAELAQLRGYRTDADRQLASVVVTTSRLRNAVAQGRPSRQVEAARRAALASWTRARTEADTSWSQAATIMKPRLSLLEQLGALGDYNDMIGRFDALGDEIRSVGT